MNLKKLPSENEAQYIWRLSSAKDSGLLDMSWPDLQKILNEELGYENSESVYRKQYAAAKKFLDGGCFHRTGEEYLKELDSKKRALESERQKLFATKVEYNRNVRQDSRQELFYQNIADHIEKINPPISEYCYGGGGFENEKEYVLTLSDIHAGAKFETATNSYSLDEMAARFGVLIDAVDDYVHKENVKNLKVLCLGDTIQGILRVSDLQLNETSIVYATVYIAKSIAETLNKISQWCDVDYYHVPSANHTQIRPLGTKASELKNEDIEYIIGNYIKGALFSNDRVHVHLNFDREYIEVPIFDEVAIAMHGHQVKDIVDTVKTLGFVNRKFYTAAFLGHYHASGRTVAGEDGTKDIEVIVCPSFVGSDPYSESLFKGARPACGMYVFDRTYGLIRTDKFVLT